MVLKQQLGKKPHHQQLPASTRDDADFQGKWWRPSRLTALRSTYNWSLDNDLIAGRREWRP